MPIQTAPSTVSVPGHAGVSTSTFDLVDVSDDSVTYRLSQVDDAALVNVGEMPTVTISRQKATAKLPRTKYTIKFKYPLYDATSKQLVGQYLDERVIYVPNILAVSGVGSTWRTQIELLVAQNGLVNNAFFKNAFVDSSFYR